ncbi:hypothetical protein H7B90_23545 [Cohnella xylanilytica]|uniref:Uncharacterized protein n=1 Tax=Cohnella xylanilytica TaxID=557555 RepID=A0A841U1G9_9BACL|nr:hypothetical protein [Cohnella xylanilytica]MBB6694375.1 hypothetical protein [Cohnella xylanilytica]
MPIPDTSGVPVFADFEMLKSKVNEIVQKYNNLLVALDTLNVVELDAKVVVAGSITGDKIKAGTITADKMDVNELSAISANLGTIVAGLIRGIQIFGSYIATAEGTYPRTEMDVSGDLLAAYYDADTWAKIIPFLGPTIQFKSSGQVGGIVFLGGKLGLTGSEVTVPSWSAFVNNATSETLQEALDNLQSQINSLDARVTALGG